MVLTPNIDNCVLRAPSTPTHAFEAFDNLFIDNTVLTSSPVIPPMPPLAQPLTEEHGIPPTPPSRSFVSVSEDSNEDCYDSDGAHGPFFDAVRNEAAFNEYDEDEVGAARVVQPNPAPPPPILTHGAIDGLKVIELQLELRRRACPVRGKKAELVVRLKEAVDRNMPLMQNLDQETLDNLAGNGFSLGAKWEIEAPNNDVVEREDERLVDGVRFREPTVAEYEMVEGINNARKRNYPMEFDRPPFISHCKQPERIDGKLVKDEHGNYVYSILPHTETLPNIDLLHSKGINTESHAADWFDIFLPMKRSADDNVSEISMADINTWTNKKAGLYNAGQGGVQYPDYEDFNVEELMRHFGVYMLNGVAPSPQVSMKFQSQEDDQANGNDLVFRVLGYNAQRRHKHFKVFLATVDPLKPVPERKKGPNWKFNPLLIHAIKVSRCAMHMGQKASMDEQTIGCKGRHPDIIRINYKNEGDGFQCDALCSDGYTYSFYFRNQPAPKKWMDKGLSPLHARCMSLIEQLQGKNYMIYLDNLYISAKFCK